MKAKPELLTARPVGELKRAAVGPQAVEAAVAATVEAETDEPAAEVPAEACTVASSAVRSPQAQSRGVPLSPALVAGLTSLERQQVRRQVRLELGSRVAPPHAAVALPVAAAAPPGPQAPLVVVAVHLDGTVPGPVPGPLVQAVPDPLALKAAVEAFVAASPGTRSNTVRPTHCARLMPNRSSQALLKRR